MILERDMFGGQYSYIALHTCMKFLKNNFKGKKK